MKEKNRKFFEALSACNPTVKNIWVSVVSGVFRGEKALLSEGAWEYTEPEGILKKLPAGNFMELSSGLYDLSFLSGEVLPAKKAALEDDAAGVSGQVQLYVEVLGQKQKLVVLGAGHVSLPVIRIGKMLGFHVTCLDDRPKFTDMAREAGADAIICGDYAEVLPEIPGDLDSYFVIVTRGHRFDQDCLRQILKKKFAYLGMMGSKRRVLMAKQGLEKEGFTKEQIAALHAPIGLPIEAETPEEVAVSILSEVISVKNRKLRNISFSREILDALSEEEDSEVPQPQKRVLATIVRRRGSAPRGIGTKMLRKADGSIVGTIGGGCAEAEVMQEMQQLSMSAQETRLVHVDLSEESAEEEGMVCGGVIDVMLDVL